MYTAYVGEDTPTQAIFFKGIMGREDTIRTVVYGDGLNLLLAIHRNPPDLIICDVILPSLDGVAVARLVKFHELTQRIPFILVSSMAADQIEGLEVCGADAFMSKPIRVPEFKSLMWRLLEPANSSSGS